MISVEDSLRLYQGLVDERIWKYKLDPRITYSNMQLFKAASVFRAKIQTIFKSTDDFANS